MSFDFEDCYWHDSILKSIYIDRSNPGNTDTVEMIIDWYDRPASKILFKDVYLFKVVMNFGIIADETILSAYISPSDDEELLAVHRRLGMNTAGVKLNCYVIETNATGGIIKIISETVEDVAIG